MTNRDVLNAIERGRCCFVKDTFATSSKRRGTIKRSDLFSEFDHHMILDMQVTALDNPDFRERLGRSAVNALIDAINIKCEC